MEEASSLTVQPVRRLAAQILMLLVVAAMFATWASSELTNASVTGIDADAGRLAIVGSLVTIALVQLNQRPAWVVAGFTVAVLAREFFELSGSDGVQVGSGLSGAVVLALAATAVLAWDLFASVVPGEDPGD